MVLSACAHVRGVPPLLLVLVVVSPPVLVFSEPPEPDVVNPPVLVFSEPPEPEVVNPLDPFVELLAARNEVEPVEVLAARKWVEVLELLIPPVPEPPVSNAIVGEEHEAAAMVETMNDGTSHAASFM
jgi:hypothetical protein